MKNEMNPSNSPMKIMIVEDETHIAEGINFNLKKHGYQTLIVDNGALAIDLWKEFNPDLIVLDIMLPKIDGLQVLKKIRSENKNLPILILSAKGHSRDRIEGLSLGSDDYLTKPFELEEFLLRVQKLLEKGKQIKFLSQQQLSSVQLSSQPLDLDIEKYIIGDSIIYFHQAKATTPHGDIQLTDQELKLLLVFINNQGKIIDREELLKSAWGYSEKIESRTIDNFIVRFRKYFEENPKQPRYFKSYRGRGYSFEKD